MASTCPSTSFAWTRVLDASKLAAEQLPYLARSSHAVALIGTKLFLFGGEHEPRKPVVQHPFLVMDLAAAPDSVWEPVQTAGEEAQPSPRIAPGMAAVGEALWMFGGRQGVDMGEGALDELWRFDSSSLRWTLVQPSTAKAGGPSPRSFHQMVSLGGALYVFGGCGPSGRKADIWRYSPASDAWEELPAPPIRGRGGAGVVAVAGRVVVVGGFAGEESNEMWSLDVSSQTWQDWSARSADLVKRSVMGVGVLEGGSRLVLFGGEVDPSSQGHEGAGGFAGDTLSLELEGEGGWTKLPLPHDSQPTPRGWYASTWSPEVGFVVSGGLVGSNQRQADLFVLAPTTTATSQA